MKLKVLVAAIIAGSLVGGAWAKGPAPKNDFREFKKEMKAAAVELAPPAVTDVGDTDSFGRAVKFIGLMGSGSVQLSEDCTPDPNFPPGPDDHCIQVNPQPAITNFSIPDVGRMLIPAKSANSLFCHMQTPIAITQLRNETATTIPSARIVVNPVYTFENAVLNDPSLIDPTTGLPFGGKLTVGLGGIRHQLTLQPGEQFLGRNSETRSCIAGAVSKRALVESFGLTAAQADKFFKNDTIVTMGINGSAIGVEFSSIVYGTRWLGD